MKKENNQIYGHHPVMEAMLSGNSLDKIFIQEDIKNDQVKELKDLARNLGVSVIKAPKEKLSKLCRKNHQGVVAFTSPVEFGNIEEIIQSVYERSETPLFLMLDKVSDVRNFGSIARSALSAGCHAIIIPHKGSSAINEESVKTSAGALITFLFVKFFRLVIPYNLCALLVLHQWPAVKKPKRLFFIVI